MIKFKGDDFKILHMYLVHAFPSISLLLILATTDLQLSIGHWKGFLPIAVIYAAVNCYATLSSGKPLYHFLDWQDYKSPLICAGLTLLFVGLYIIIAHLTIWMNQAKLVVKDIQKMKENENRKKSKVSKLE